MAECDSAAMCSGRDGAARRGTSAFTVSRVWGGGAAAAPAAVSLLVLVVGSTLGALDLRQGFCRKLALCCPLLHQFHTEIDLRFQLWHLLLRRTFPTRLLARVLLLGLGRTQQRRVLAAHGRRQFGDGGAAGVAAVKGAAGLHQDGRL